LASRKNRVKLQGNACFEKMAKLCAITRNQGRVGIRISMLLYLIDIRLARIKAFHNVRIQGLFAQCAEVLAPKSE
jgi:hypothetical protein